MVRGGGGGGEAGGGGGVHLSPYLSLLLNDLKM